MSSAGGGNENASDQRKMRRVCDLCYKRKVRCRFRDDLCPASSLIEQLILRQCTYAALVIGQRRGSKAYIQNLETRFKNAEKLLHLLSPDTYVTDILEQIDGSLLETGKSSEPPSSSENAALHPLAELSLDDSSCITGDSDGLYSSDDEYATFSTNEGRRPLSERGNHKYYGKSSGITFLQSAIDAKRGLSEGISIPNVDHHLDGRVLKTRRPEYWCASDVQWSKPSVKPRHPDFYFPEPDLMSSLVGLYFSTLNNFYPLLHRPTFESALSNSSHKRDRDFGAVVLLVCAIGARFSDDPRVMFQSSPRLAGFAWFHQVQIARHPLITIPSLYDVQVYCLSVIFLGGISPTPLRWNMIGAGLRSIQEIGAHRRQTYEAASVESELWKRAFWILLALDRLTSSRLGRMCAVREEDFDIDLPTECDDEYWTDPDPQCAFNQPPGKPSSVSYFIYLVKLNQVYAVGLRTIYAMKKSRAVDHNQLWELRMVATLDSTLNKWMESLPHHLRWDPHREDPLFFKQSAVLHMHYYHLQIWIHQSFVKSKTSPSFSTSFAICVNAARSCFHLLDESRQRLGFALYMWIKPLFSSAVVLLLNVWSRRPSVDPGRDMKEVEKCLEVLHSLESRWQMGGRARDILCSLIHTKEDILVREKQPSSKKKNAFVTAGTSEPPPGYTSPFKDAAAVPSPAKPWTPFIASAWPNIDPALSQMSMHSTQFPDASQQDTQSLLSCTYNDSDLLFATNPPTDEESNRQDPNLDYHYLRFLSSSLTSNRIAPDVNTLSAFPFESMWSPDPTYNRMWNTENTTRTFNFSSQGEGCGTSSSPTQPSNLEFLEMSDLGLDDDTLAMLTDVPTTERWDDWRIYASSVNEMVRNIQDSRTP